MIRTKACWHGLKTRERTDRLVLREKPNDLANVQRIENDRSQMDLLGQRLGVVEPEDWYPITSKQAAKNGGTKIMFRYGNSLRRALLSAYPEHHWEAWRFEVVSRDYWNHPVHCREFLDRLGEQLGIQKKEDWYSIGCDPFGAQGRRLLRHFGGSLYSTLAFAYPEFQWQPWKFRHSLPKGSWSHVTNRRECLALLADKIGIKRIEDWDNIKTSEVREKGGARLLRYYQGSMTALLSDTYPEYRLQPWMLKKSPKHVWHNVDNQKQLMSWLGKQLHVKEMKDWYRVSLKQIMKIASSIPFQQFSMSELLHVAYPDYSWDVNQLLHTKKGNLISLRNSPRTEDCVPRGFWANPKNCANMLGLIGKQLGIKELEDWYCVRWKHVSNLGGSGMLHHFGNSPLAVLSFAYPTFKWEPWRLYQVPHGFWDNKTNLRQFLDWLAQRLSVKSMDEWYRVSVDQIERVTSVTAIQKYGGLFELLKKVYPDHSWDITKLFLPSKGCQRTLKVIVQELFPTSEIQEDFLHPNIRLQSGLQMQLDLFLPDQNLAFEYHGEQHYHEIHVYGPQVQFVERDEEKRWQCKQHGITLVEVPYWWNFEKESLAATIRLQNCKLVPHESK